MLVCFVRLTRDMARVIDGMDPNGLRELLLTRFVMASLASMPGMC